jgi:diguanylate cyclase (GGDEF)-like protein
MSDSSASTRSPLWVAHLLGATDPEILKARYQSLLSQIPLLLVCIQVILLPSFAMLLEGKRDFSLLLLLGAAEYFSIHVLVFWLKNRRRERDADFIRRSLGLFSLYLILASVATAISLIESVVIGGGQIDYALYCAGWLASVCMPVMLIMLGRSAYFYCCSLLVANIVASFYAGLDAAWLSAVIAIVLASGSMIALSRQSQRFDQLVQLQSQTQALSRENAQLASLDMLTGLPNRRHFFDHAQRALDNSVHQNRVFVLGVVDLDDFKPLNDTYGHALGDRVLQTVGGRLSALSSATLRFHRIGGDEFAFYMSVPEHGVDINLWAKGLISRLEEPIGVEGRTVSITASIGMVVGSRDLYDPQKLYDCADYALYTAKRQGKGLVATFTPILGDAMRAERRLEQALRSADLQREISAAFQPIVYAQSGAVSVFEILARWNSQALGPISPADFIPVAERIGLVSTITLIMLRQGLSALKDWPEHIGLSLNLSAHDIMSAEVVSSLLEDIRSSEIDPRRITFEITETAVLADIQKARSHIELFKNAGIRLALDDFGSGYTSLGHLQHFQLDKIKLDRAFATDTQNSPVNTAIVRSLVDLCRSLDLELIVEGAEDQSTSNALRKLGCTYLQGYGFSKPLTREEALLYIASCEQRTRVAQRT